MYQAYRMCTRQNGQTINVIVMFEETIGMSIHTINGEELFCAHGSKSPMFPEDMKLSKAELIEKDGFDCDEAVGVLVDYVKKNYTLSFKQLNLLTEFATNKPCEIADDGSSNCAFNI